jgi:glutathione synthase/RimK-type ligase-like ATP-grasp enzyme
MSESKVFILHENSQWTLPLELALQRLGTPYESWHLGEGQLNLDAIPPTGVFYSRMSASAHTRGHRHAPEFCAALLRWLEAHERRVVNGYGAIQLEVSKAAQSFALRAAGVATPKTIAAFGKQQTLHAAAQMDGPFVIKHNCGGKGLGVRKFTHVEGLSNYLDGPSFEEPVDGIQLIQAYIESPEPFITRCEFVGGKFLYALRVDTSDGFELCPAQECESGSGVCEVTATPKFSIVPDFVSPLLKQYESVLKRNGIEVAGIEFIVDRDGRPYTYDINTNTNYNAAAEAAAGVSAMDTLAEFLSAELHSALAPPVSLHAADPRRYGT